MQAKADAELRIQGFLARATHLENELVRMSEKLKCTQKDLEKSREDAYSSEALKNKYKIDVTEPSNRYKEYERAIIDVRRNAKVITRRQYRKFLDFDDFQFYLLRRCNTWLSSGI